MSLHIPNLLLNEFPSIREKDDKLWDLNRLFMCLVYDNNTCFVKGLQIIAEKRPNDLCKLFVCIGFLLWQLETWLNPSIAQTVISSIENLKLIDNILNHTLMNILENYQNSFKFWKGKRYSNIVDAIDAILPEPKFRHKKMIEHFDRGEVVNILIEWDFNVTTQLHNGHTALYHAVEHNNLKAVSKLLSKGSFIGNATNLFDPCVWNVDSKVLENHFDDCITRCVDDDRFIEIDFKNLISPLKYCERCDGSCSDEMKAIELISNSNDHKRLLIHPMISTFVLLKWNRLAFVLYVDFILCTLLSLSTVGYILKVDNDRKTCVDMTLTFLTSFFTVFLSSRRIFDQVFNCFYRVSLPQNRIRNCWQCFHTFLIVVFILLLLVDISPAYRPIFATICILLIAGELFFLAGSLFWSFSKYYVMFLDVAWSSLRSLQLCVILLPAFGVSFYLLLQNQTPISNSIQSNGTVDMSNSFNHARSSLIKIIAMSVGEFEATSSNFDSSPMSAYLFLGFLFLISTVFMNLMNGLAVSDTQKIQTDAESTSMIQRVRVLAYYEGVKSFKQHWFR